MECAVPKRRKRRREEGEEVVVEGKRKEVVVEEKRKEEGEDVVVEGKRKREEGEEGVVEGKRKREGGEEVVEARRRKEEGVMVDVKRRREDVAEGKRRREDREGRRKGEELTANKQRDEDRKPVKGKERRERSEGNGGGGGVGMEDKQLTNIVHEGVSGDGNNGESEKLCVAMLPEVSEPSHNLLPSTPPPPIQLGGGGLRPCLEPAPAQPERVSALQHFTPGAVLLRAGLSPSLAGSEILALATDVVSRHLREVPSVGSERWCAAASRGWANATLLQSSSLPPFPLGGDLGPHPRALTALADFALRRRLLRKEVGLKQLCCVCGR